MPDIVNNGFFFGTLDVFTSLSIISAVTIITLKNPIVSVLFLIMLFFFVSGYLICSGGTFIGLAYLLVYIGAVSILFLFILMLINIRVSELVTDTKNSIPLVIIVAILFKYANDILLFINTLQFDYWLFTGDFGIVSYLNWEDNLRTFDHLATIGFILYTAFAILLLIVSIILLLAMVGAIAITATPGSSIQISKIHFLQSNIYKNFDSGKLKKFLIKTAILFGLSISTKHIIQVYLDINVFIDHLNPISWGCYLALLLAKISMDLYVLNIQTITGMTYLPVPIGESLVLQTNSPSSNPNDMDPTGNSEVLGGTGGTLPNQDTAMTDQGTAATDQGTAMTDQGTAATDQGTAMTDQGTAVTDQGARTSNPEIPTTAVKYPGYSPPDSSLKFASGEDYREWLRLQGEKHVRRCEEFWSNIDTTEIKRGKVYKVYTEGTGIDTVKYYRNEDGTVFTRSLYKYTSPELRGEENRELRTAHRDWEKTAGYNNMPPLDTKNKEMFHIPQPLRKHDYIIEDFEDHRSPAWLGHMTQDDFHTLFGSDSGYTFPGFSNPECSSTVSGSMGPPSNPMQSTTAGPSNPTQGTITGSSANLNTGSRPNPNTEDNPRPSKRPRLSESESVNNPVYQYNRGLSNPMQSTIAGPSNSGQGRINTWPSNSMQSTIVGPSNSRQGRITLPSNSTQGTIVGPSNSGQGTITWPSNSGQGTITWPSNSGQGRVISGPNNPGYASNTSGYGNNQLVGNNSGSINPGYGSDLRPNNPNVFVYRPGEIGIRPNLPSIFRNRPWALFNSAEVYPSGDIGNLVSDNRTRFTSDPSRYISAPRGNVGNSSGSGSNFGGSGSNFGGSRSNFRGSGSNSGGSGRNPGGSR